MMIKLKDSREAIGAPPFCKHAGSPLLLNAPNIPNCGLVLKLARYHVSRTLEASLSPCTSAQHSVVRPHLTALHDLDQQTLGRTPHIVSMYVCSALSSWSTSNSSSRSGPADSRSETSPSTSATVA